MTKLSFTTGAVILILSLCLTITQTGNGQSSSNQSSDDQVWRCSLDGKFYTVTYWNGVHIRAINSGQMMAEIPPLTDKRGRVKTDKNGNNKLEGRWGPTTYGGLIVIQDVEPDKGPRVLACADSWDPVLLVQ